jgi:hypothetical protein
LFGRKPRNEGPVVFLLQTSLLDIPELFDYKREFMAPIQSETFIVKFPAVTTDEANKLASSLADELNEIAGLDKAQPARDNPETQDFGATLILVLGTASVTAIARGIEKWLARAGTTVEIHTASGKVVMKDVQGKDAVAIAKALSGHR